MSYMVYSKELALMLRKLGYRIESSAPNENNPRLDVYFFEDSPSLRETIKEYQRDKDGFFIPPTHLHLHSKHSNQNQNQKSDNLVRVFSANLAGYLRERGFLIVGTEPNKRKPWLRVFLFEDTEDFQKSYDEFFQSE